MPAPGYQNCTRTLRSTDRRVPPSRRKLGTTTRRCSYEGPRPFLVGQVDQPDSLIARWRDPGEGAIGAFESRSEADLRQLLVHHCDIGVGVNGTGIEQIECTGQDVARQFRALLRI